LHIKGQGKLIVYSDSDFASDPTDRKSTSGYKVLMEKKKKTYLDNIKRNQ